MTRLRVYPYVGFLLTCGRGPLLAGRRFPMASTRSGFARRQLFHAAGRVKLIVTLDRQRGSVAVRRRAVIAGGLIGLFAVVGRAPAAAAAQQAECLADTVVGAA